MSQLVLMEYMYPLEADSSSAGNGIPSDFTINFGGLDTSHGYWDMAMTKATLSYSWNNISAALGNNIIGYTTGSGSSIPVTLPDGEYGVNDINNLLQQAITQNGGTATNISIIANGNTFKTNVVLTSGYTLDLSLSTIYQLLGWSSPIVISTAGLTASPNDANVTPVQTVLFHCSITYGSYYNGKSSDVIGSLAPNLAPGSLLTEQPYYPIYQKINQKQLNQARFYITDQLNNPLDLNGQEVTMNVVLRQRVAVDLSTLK
jgi:hypothetical protein